MSTLITLAALVQPAFGGGRMGPPSWWDLPMLAGTGAALAWNARRRGYGGSTIAAVAVIFGLFILADLSRLL